MDIHGFEAKVIEDTRWGESRLTTLQLRYPRLIHSEFMTHRVFSRNASSSRAIPVKKIIEQVLSKPAMPIHWGKNVSGMQAKEELSPVDCLHAMDLWNIAAKDAAKTATEMMNLGLHKQVANRILEPFQFMNVIVTSSKWTNFFELRDHPDADPNICHLAKHMKRAMEEHEPRRVAFDDTRNALFHLPYVSTEEREQLTVSVLAKISAARCARVSYLTHDGENPVIEKDLELYERLVGSAPMHASPVEHQAKALVREEEINGRNMSGNFDKYWGQFRKYIEVGEPQEFWQTS